MTPQSNSTQGAALDPNLLLRAKLRLLQMHFDAGVGHIGGNLSALDIVMCLYHQTMGPRDAFVLRTAAFAQDGLRRAKSVRMTGPPAPTAR